MDGTRRSTKSDVGIPSPGIPRGVDLEREARTSRRRLYPVSLVYGAYGVAVVALGLREAPGTAAAFALAGVVLWTWVEYMVHRHVLHGVFPPGPGRWRAFLHRHYDHLHWEHHERPWDGRHINGTLRDTGPAALVLAALSFLAPLPTAPVLLGALLVSYVAEEWIHHSCHYYTFRGRYFRHLRSRHLHHHGARGADATFGLSNGIWDVVYGTRPDRIATRPPGRARLPPPASPVPASEDRTRPLGA